MSLHPYESTVDEVLDQYELTEKQKAIVKERVAATGCPWFSRIVYMRTHHIASQLLLGGYTRGVEG